MDYKALEDLVNILVRKTGLELFENGEKKELEEKLDEISSKVLLLNNENKKEELEIFLNEKEIILSSLNDIGENSIICAKEILKTFTDGKPYTYAKDKVNELVKLAKEELEKTHNEINNTNIFTEMDKYNKKVGKLKSEIESKVYEDKLKNEVINFNNAYHNSKLKSLKERKKYIPNQIEAINNIIEELKRICEKLKDNRMVYIRNLNSKKREFYKNLLKSYSKEEINEIKLIIKDIENEINENIKNENEYIKEINKYKEEIAKKENDLAIIEKEIFSLEENKVNENNRNYLEIFTDMLELLKQKDRLESLSKQQQYLYVDPDVIKEEIELLWNKKIKPASNFEDIEIF